MTRASTVTIRMFGALHTVRRKRGLASIAEIEVPTEGRTARAIALDLDLPFDKIEGVFVNHLVYGLEHRIFPGDRIAFVPTGVPGPHRYLLGIHESGRAQGDED